MGLRDIPLQLWMIPLLASFDCAAALVAPAAADPPSADDLVCYSCNSLHDPHCGDPFSDYSIGAVRCSLLPPMEHLVPHDSNPLHVLRPPRPVVCRKLVQMVQNHTRVVRGCGYIEHDRDDKQCVQRTGTKDIRLLYCACTGSLCNGAGGGDGGAIYRAAAAAAAVALALRRQP